MIDWNLPLETDEPTPRAVKYWGEATSPDQAWLVVEGISGPRLYNPTGRHFKEACPPVRNVRQPAVRTADEHLQRMEALVRRMAKNESSAWKDSDGWAREAIEIVKMLPVDPDEAEARKLCDASPYDLSDAVVVTNRHIYRLVLAAIKRGRELASQ